MSKTQSEPKTRLVTGVMITAVVGLVLLFSHIQVVVSSATALLCIGSAWELHQAVCGKRVDWITYFCLFAVAGSVILPVSLYSMLLTLLFPLSCLFFGYLMYQVGKHDRIHTEILLVICLIVSVFFRAIPEIRSMEKGFWLLGITVLAGSLNDIGAYAIGKRFGKHKLAPKISPKKTIEGAVGGTLVSSTVLMLVSYCCEQAGFFQVDYPALAVYLLLATLAGQFGDLAMSVVKRIVGIKDFANILPGHGGLLDRFDSLLFVAPFTYLFCRHFGAFYL